MMEMGGSEAQKLVWGGAIPLQIHLHDSEITALTPPPPLLVLGPRLGYLPLLAPLVKPHFSSSLPPMVDAMWFEYKGLPLKWYIPTGVLFDLLCAEPERPWNLTVHFRGYPSELLSPCDGEDSVKWSFINSLKEAAYIINRNCTNVMNMSQSDQLELWKCVEKGNLEGYLRIASKLKLGGIVEEVKAKGSSQPSATETDHRGPGRTGRFPVRLYVRNIDEDLEELADATSVNSWDNISYINQPVDTRKKEVAGMCVTLLDAVKALLPEVFMDEASVDEGITQIQLEDVPTSAELDAETVDVKNIDSVKEGAKDGPSDKQLLVNQSTQSRIKRICIQGIEPDMDLPFSWVISNLMNPEFYLHVCVYVGVSTDENDAR